MMIHALFVFPDSAGHILGECGQKDMKSPAIEHHNAAGRIIAQIIRQGSLGSCVMTGDIGNADKCKTLNLHDTRFPEWLLSDGDLRKADTNCTMARPDLMLVNIKAEEAQRLHKRKKGDRNGYRTDMLSSRPDVQAIKVLVVEVGYTSELRYKGTMSWSTISSDTCRIPVHNHVVLATTGGVFHSNLDSMWQAGISNERSKTAQVQFFDGELSP